MFYYTYRLYCLLGSLHLSSLTLRASWNQPSSSRLTLDLSTNAGKLAYLSAWQSANNDTPICLMNFTPGGRPICLDTGATSCISNRKEDFIQFTPVKDSVLKGISSGLSIEGCGTICWKITDDLGDEITLNIHDSLYVPQAPMCLLSPQSVA